MITRPFLLGSRLVVGLIVLGMNAHCASAQTVVRVGAWNIEWLGVPNNRTGSAHNVAQKPEDIAEYIKESKVDILALEEICDDTPGTASRENSTLSSAFAKIKTDTGVEWEVVLFPKKNAADTSQMTGIAWKKSVATLVGTPLLIPVDYASPDGFNLWDRTPHAVKLSLGTGKTDLVVVPLHMKSNRGGASRTRKQRQQEATALAAKLPAVSTTFTDSDIILLGDTNILNNSEPAISSYTGAGLRDLNAADDPTTFSGSAPFDRLFVSATQPEFVASSFEVFQTDHSDDAEHKLKLSDHYMAVTEITVASDDD